MMAEKDQHTETGNELFLERKPLKEFKIPEEAERFIRQVYIHSLYLIQLWMFLFIRYFFHFISHFFYNFIFLQ